MNIKQPPLWLVVFLLLAWTALLPVSSNAQCYLNQGCQPVDDLTYIPNGTGQVYHGDGASNNGAGGWTTYYSDVNQCLSCHFGTDTEPYLMTGHRNSLRKIAPGSLWGGPDNTPYLTTDDHYGSGSTYNWTAEQITIGWCNPLATPLQNGLPPLDPSCQYPYYTLPNSHAPAPYSPVAQTPAAGGIRNLFYLYGAWMNYGGTSNPTATQLNSVFDTGFGGDNYPIANFDCARCHATGYNPSKWAPEPTSNTGGVVTAIPDANFPRLPSDGYIAPGTNGSSSWYLSGVQCEACHVAAYGYGSHPYGNVTPTIAYNEASTALCMQCHRQESITMANPNTNPPTVGSINPASALSTLDHGYCPDLSGSNYATCLANGNQWVYKPYVEHEAGQAFLNSPHARFTGNAAQNSQNASDLSVMISGTYASEFSENINNPANNYGCVGCHNPHQSTVSQVAGAQPLSTNCMSCHALSQNIFNTINHPTGPGTPFPTGTSADLPGACITCHMQAALGQPNSHLFRISYDANYRTYPTAAQLYTQNVYTLGTEPEYSPMNGTYYTPASWLDVDLACGQCHVGNDGVTNDYGLTMPPGMPGAHAYTKAQLAYWASWMHPGDPTVPNPTYSPAPGIYHSPQTVAISDSQAGATIYYTMDGTLPTTSSPVYSAPIQISTGVSFYAMATYPKTPRSAVVLGQYSIILPIAPAPLFSPPPSLFSSPQSVTLSNTANLPMYYTVDGSTPTTSSTLYAGPIAVSQNTTINAITAAVGYQTSAVSSGFFQIQAPTPTISPSGNTFYAPVNATISDTASSATIYYTTNGSQPTPASTSCPNPCNLTVSTTATIKAIASGGNYASSNVAVAAYTIAAANPVFSPSPNTYYNPLTVTITESTSGVLIYYAINGFPTTSSPSCTSPCQVAISTSSILRAMADGSGISQSGTTTGSYTIAANTPVFSPPAGNYTGAQTITISDSTSGVSIYYTTNGSIPTTSSTQCSNPCQVGISTSTTLRAIAAGNGISQSSVATAGYTLH
jgi:predicted CXXCH cytochrome family protein